MVRGMNHVFGVELAMYRRAAVWWKRITSYVITRGRTLHPQPHWICASLEEDLRGITRNSLSAARTVEGLRG